MYSGIIADPAWQYGKPQAMPSKLKLDGERAKAVDLRNHYDTMSLDEIKAIEVPSAKNALLFLWTTNPFLADGSATQVVKAWGFEPVSVLTWAKVQADGITPSRKTGHWFRSASEHVIFAKKGKVLRPGGFPPLATWFAHGRLPHSVKPDVLHEIVEQAVPEGPWLEMFARRSRPGWDLWGNQAPQGLNKAIDDLTFTIRKLVR